VTRKTVFKMNYNVSSGTLNSTIPYHTSIERRRRHRRRRTMHDGIFRNRYL